MISLTHSLTNFWSTFLHDITSCTQHCWLDHTSYTYSDRFQVDHRNLNWIITYHALVESKHGREIDDYVCSYRMTTEHNFRRKVKTLMWCPHSCDKYPHISDIIILASWAQLEDNTSWYTWRICYWVKTDCLVMYVGTVQWHTGGHNTHNSTQLERSGGREGVGEGYGQMKDHT